MWLLGLLAIDAKRLCESMVVQLPVNLSAVNRGTHVVQATPSGIKETVDNFAQTLVIRSERMSIKLTRALEEAIQKARKREAKARREAAPQVRFET